MPHGILLLPEEEYPEGGRWWEPISTLIFIPFKVI